MTEAITEGFRIAPQQERLFLLQATETFNTPYRARCRVRMDGYLDVGVLESALALLVQRYEILRTTFHYLPGMNIPVQVVEAPIQPTLVRRDLTMMTEQMQEREVATLLAEPERGKLDLTRKPLERVTLVSLAPARAELLINLSALYCDSQGLANLVRELSRAYQTCSLGPALTDEPSQYADLAEWQHELLEAADTEVGREYWRQALSSVRALSLAGERVTADASQHYLPRWLGRQLDGITESRVEAYCEQQQTTIQAFFLSCWQTLLGRLTDQSDLVIGVAFSGRSYEALDDALGLFTKYLPIQCSTEKTLPFNRCVEESAVALGRAAKWQEYYAGRPAAADATTKRGAASGFDFGFELEPAGSAYQAAGLTFTLLERRACTERFKLKLSCVTNADAIHIELHYDASLYEEAAIRCLLDQYQCLLLNAAMAPDAALGDLNLVTAAEREQVVFKFNDTAADYGSVQCLHELFAQQASRTPDAPALIADGEHLTYAELDARANQLARYLQRHGIGPEARVGLCLERSIEMVVALLGILKAGGAYLPLDPQYPQDRLDFMVAEAGVLLLVTTQTLATNWATGVAKVCCLDAPETLWTKESSAPVASPVSGANLAYVIYTSGSTGRPKGVEMSHAAISNRILWMHAEYPLAAGDRVLHKTALSFDASIWELFAPWLGGAAVVLARPGGQADPGYLAATVSLQEITTLQLVPSMLRVLVAEDELKECRSLRHLWCGGEALAAELVARCRAQTPWITMHNLYGPTEAAIDATHWLCADQRERLPIGQPLGNVQVYVLDDRFEPTAIGVAGELYVGGAGLARAYLQRPDLTAARFVPNPFAAGARLYRTGDLARYLPNGELEYLGRIDQQVKLRGYRIELGEIEAVLGQHDAVLKCAVTVQEENGDQQLMAYVVPRQSAHASYLEKLLKLPNEMAIDCVNVNEARVIYKEIFEDESYLRHGITINDGDCIFDVGANIGLFTLYVCQYCADARVYAFEPISPIFEKLRNNVGLYGLNAKLFDCGLSDAAREAIFTYYPMATSMSSIYADAIEDEQVTQPFLVNQDVRPTSYANDLLAERFRGEQVVAHLRTLSEVVRDEGIDQIDLLKIDVEKGEFDVLRGIGETDWPKIKQLVLEVHDIDGRVTKITELLKEHRFDVVVEQDPTLEGTNLYNVYAVSSRKIRAPSQSRQTSSAWLSDHSPQPIATADLRSYLSEQLPDYMVPAVFVLLDELPLLPNGKINRGALPSLNGSALRSERAYAAPRTPVEELLAGIWAELLGCVRVGLRDNFFELGGHSLLATQLVARVRESLRVEVPLRLVFEAPGLATFAAEIEKALRAGVGLAAPNIKPTERDGPLPLSFAQQRLWFLDQLDPGNVAYNLVGAVRLEGMLNVPALAAALNEVVRRHDVLRTTFVTSAGEPVQVIAAERELALTVVALDHLSAEEREPQVARHIGTEASRPFDLTRAPLLRASLLRLEEQGHVLLLTMHHIIGDGWSTNVMVRELAALYDAFSQKQPSPLPPLAIQYADYAVWQRDWLRGEILATQLAYWTDQLADAPVLKLPTDYPRPKLQTFNGSSFSFNVSAELAESLKALSRREGGTLFMTVLAAFKVLLSRYSGQTDIVVGTPIANRQRLEVEGLIGFFANTLALRTRVEADDNFTTFLRRVRAVTLGGYAHQDVPFEAVVEALQPVRSLSHTPLFQVLFVGQTMPPTTLGLPGLALRAEAVTSGTEKFDLSVFMHEGETGVAFKISYNTDLFAAATIERLAAHFSRLLEAIAVSPEQNLATLPLLSEAERQQALLTENETHADYPETVFVQQMFADQAARTPEATALVCGAHTLMYSALNEQAERVAQYLRALGVGPEVLVGILMERTLEMVVGILGVLKAGGAYLPLDARYPPERLLEVLAAARVETVLTHSRLAAHVQANVRQVLLDAPLPEIEDAPSRPVNSGVTGDNLAYVIYTSGSTGQPKGVMITHGGLAHYLHWCLKQYYDGPGHGAAVQSSIGFDLTVTSLFSPLLAGQTVMLLPEHQELDELTTILASGPNFSLLKITPAHLQVLEQLLPTEAASQAARALIIGGEALRYEQLSFWRAHAPRTRLINEYGPTETVVGCCVYEVPAAAQTTLGAVPIGRPIDNTQMYVLDSALQPVPVGIVGELYIGGVGVARGYLNRPDLTAEKFIPHPYSATIGARLYRTGDLGRYLPDGNIECLGRVDRQIKIRGYRVELSEIEIVLIQQPDVREAVVIATADQGQSQSLVAYVVPAETELSSEELRRRLHSRLPAFMVPTAFVFLDALPLTRNGKLDLRALPTVAPDTSRSAFVAPRNAVEETIAGIWAEVLELKQVGVDDNFFELGGHSLLATKILSRLRETFRVDLPLRALFEGPTIAEVSQAIIAAEPEPGQVEKIARVVQKIKNMSPEARREALQARKASQSV